MQLNIIISNKLLNRRESYHQVNRNKIFIIFINIQEVIPNKKIIKEVYHIIKEIDQVVQLE
jgi:hypothetical protein